MMSDAQIHDELHVPLVEGVLRHRFGVDGHLVTRSMASSAISVSLSADLRGILDELLADEVDFPWMEMFFTRLGLTANFWRGLVAPFIENAALGAGINAETAWKMRINTVNANIKDAETYSNFVSVCQRILEGEPALLVLLEHASFFGTLDDSQADNKQLLIDLVVRGALSEIGVTDGGSITIPTNEITDFAWFF